jgi:hypothetical protein
VWARLRLGRVSSSDSVKEAAKRRGGQRFLDMVYGTKGRTEGFKGGLVVYFNGVHVPIPDQLMWIGLASRINDGGQRLGKQQPIHFACFSTVEDPVDCHETAMRNARL